jgi:hypothetical protein
MPYERHTRTLTDWRVPSAKVLSAKVLGRIISSAKPGWTKGKASRVSLVTDAGAHGKVWIQERGGTL